VTGGGGGVFPHLTLEGKFKKIGEDDKKSSQPDRGKTPCSGVQSINVEQAYRKIEKPRGVKLRSDAGPYATAALSREP